VIKNIKDMKNKENKTISKSEKEIKNYFRQNYNWDMTEDDYQEASQSLYYLGKAIYFFLKTNGIVFSGKTE